MKRFYLSLMLCLAAVTAWAQVSDDYLPFVVDGKVWKVARMQEAGGGISELEFFYFAGDTLVDGRTCRKWMRHDEDGQHRRTSYVGALYEEGRRVYLIRPRTTAPVLLYDFGAQVGSTVEVYDAFADTTTTCYIAGKYTRAFTTKGQDCHIPCTQVWFYPDHSDQPLTAEWLEGIGSLGEPSCNSYPAGGWNCTLLECSVNEETCYYADMGDLEDIASSLWQWPEDYMGELDGDKEKKKDKLDFTHVIKTRPTLYTTPGARRIGGQCRGELLEVSFVDFRGRYACIVTDAVGQTLFSRSVDTDNLMLLELLLSGYAEGEYTITFENDDEAFTARFRLPLDGNGVGGVALDGVQSGFFLHDLCGRRIGAGQSARGLYIRDGRKWLIR